MNRGAIEKLRRIIEKAVQSLPDDAALEAVTLYPRWTAGQEYAGDYKVQRNGKLYRLRQPHTAQPGWEPENAPALWERIDETHEGTLEDPIPYAGGMALSAGLYYSQGGVVYRCIRDTVEPVYAGLAELTGLYVEAVSG